LTRLLCGIAKISQVV
jgi:hypothetical protein